MVGLPHDIQYCFDCMSELHEITGDVYSYFFSVRENATEFLDEVGVNKEPLMEDYNRWRNSPESDAVTKACLTFDGLLGLGYQFDDFVKGITNKAIMLRDGKKPRKQDALAVLKGTEIDCAELRWVGNMRRILGQCREDFALVSAEDVKLAQQTQREKTARFYASEYQLGDGRTRQVISGKAMIEYRRRERKRRKVMKKSVDLLSRFVKPSDLKLFLGRDFVTVTGTEFIFKVKAWRLDGNSLDIKVHDKADNYLATLCFYYDNMPVADQMVAMLLDIHSGNELEILKVANFPKVSEKFYKNKTLAKIMEDRNAKKPISQEDTVENIGNMIENAIEAQLPGSRNIHKYHESFKPIVKELILKKFSKELNYFRELSRTLDNNQPLLLGFGG